ncbi:MAG TPA: class II fructose-bisphosphatase [Bdellovibrionota bacterium]|nr:class II fructose-bisphosphatase [Bdellovibrionota bacterium]
MDRNLALEFVRVTEAAAIASARWMGLGQKDAADQAAVDSMRKALEHLDVRGTVVIGEGERDEAPMLYIGETFGSGGKASAELDVALDPLEGTNLCANGHNNALSVIAVAERGNFLHAPDTYMDKVAVGPDCRGLLRYEMSTREKVEIVARAKNKSLRETTVCILERDRHRTIISELRSLGCRIVLIGDGDVSAAIATCNPETGIDLLLGSGGAPEGVISAAAMRCLGGDFIGKLLWRSDEEKSRAAKMGIKDFDKIYSVEELARGPVMFCATGVTDGSWLRGVKFFGGGCTTNSIVMRSSSGTIREVSTRHHFATKPASGAIL